MIGIERGHLLVIQDFRLSSHVGCVSTVVYSTPFIPLAIRRPRTNSLPCDDSTYGSYRWVDLWSLLGYQKGLVRYWALGIG